MNLHDMYASCREYDPKPIHQFTDAEANLFANRLARDAKSSMLLTREEALCYANAIYSSIQHFNMRSKDHKAHMRYLKECAIIQREIEEQRKREEQQKKQMLIIIK